MTVTYPACLHLLCQPVHSICQSRGMPHLPAMSHPWANDVLTSAPKDDTTTGFPVQCAAASKVTEAAARAPTPAAPAPPPTPKPSEAKQAAKDTVKDAAPQAVKDTVKDAAPQASQAVKDTVKDAAPQAAKHAAKDVVPQGAKDIVKDAVPQAVKDALPQASQAKDAAKEGEYLQYAPARMRNADD